MTFNGEAVPGSPFPCTVLDTDSVALTGEGLRSAPANATTSFRVDPKGAGDFDLRAWVVCKWQLFALQCPLPVRGLLPCPVLTPRGLVTSTSEPGSCVSGSCLHSSVPPSQRSVAVSWFCPSPI